MRLLELEVHNIRGIVDLSLNPEGENFLVWGPNGAGKSAVVDAIDFLLTGRITRLRGKGTRGISLGKHGQHIDHEPRDAMVRAVIKIPGVAQRIEISRCIESPTVLVCDETRRAELKPIMDVASRGQHVLTRREILQYITAEAATRAQEIQELLNISDIERVRKTLVRVKNDSDKDVTATTRNVQIAQGQVNATTQRVTYDSHDVLTLVNDKRAILDGDPLQELASAKLKHGIRAQSAISTAKDSRPLLLGKDLGNLREVFQPSNKEALGVQDEQLRALLKSVHAEPAALEALKRRQLIELGISLLAESGSCPLCDKAWPPGQLNAYLEERLATAKTATQRCEAIGRCAKAISEVASRTVASLQKVVAVAACRSGLKKERAVLETWLTDLQSVTNALAAPLEKYPLAGIPAQEVAYQCAPPTAQAALDRVEQASLVALTAASPEQAAWDTLTRLEENMKALERAETRHAKTQTLQRRAERLLQGFQEARDKALSDLYDRIRDRFVDLYRQLHGDDEGEFEASLEPVGAGLQFEVDFYGRGAHPPHALHSEGHQDTMGLCLYLALSEYLTAGVIDLVILDDVVMSVDAGHRRQLCKLLKSVFADRQALITTHDRTWASQLKHEGVVSSAGSIEFYNWHINTGPQVSSEVDMWQRIAEDLKKDDVASAASRLRRGAEGFFSDVCDALRALVRHRSDARWELGETLPAAMGEYKKLLKRAKAAAQSWGKKDAVDDLSEQDSVSGQIFRRTNAEQWAIDTNVHYNAWANFTEADFRPVVEAFQDLYTLFTCTKCGGLLQLSTRGRTGESVTCNCGNVRWNLIEKGKGN